MVVPAIPSHVYLDTSVAAAAIIGGSAHSQASQDFFAELASANSRVYFSRLVRIEVAQILKKYATKNLAPPSLQQTFELDRFSQDFMIRQRWLNFGMGQFDTLMHTFSRAYELPIHKQTCQHGEKIMAQYNLDSNDAIHVATALRNDLKHLATIDGDYTRVGELNVILVRDPIS
jgi:predicted nucleic acid-binding protein